MIGSRFLRVKPIRYDLSRTQARPRPHPCWVFSAQKPAPLLGSGPALRGVLNAPLNGDRRYLAGRPARGNQGNLGKPQARLSVIHTYGVVTCVRVSEICGMNRRIFFGSRPASAPRTRRHLARDGSSLATRCRCFALSLGPQESCSVRAANQCPGKHDFVREISGAIA
jgi:hypothetical protein